MNAPWLRAAAGAYRGIFGVPDYDAYLVHMGERHPGRPVLGREEFARQWIERRYSGLRGRCC